MVYTFIPIYDDFGHASWWLSLLILFGQSRECAGSWTSLSPPGAQHMDAGSLLSLKKKSMFLEPHPGRLPGFVRKCGNCLQVMLSCLLSPPLCLRSLVRQHVPGRKSQILQVFLGELWPYMVRFQCQRKLPGTKHFYLTRKALSFSQHILNPLSSTSTAGLTRGSHIGFWRCLELSLNQHQIIISEPNSHSCRLNPWFSKFPIDSQPSRGQLCSAWMFLASSASSGQTWCQIQMGSDLWLLIVPFTDGHKMPPGLQWKLPFSWGNLQ